VATGRGALPGMGKGSLKRGGKSNRSMIKIFLDRKNFVVIITIKIVGIVEIDSG
jgi:hypothetical protein